MSTTPELAVQRCIDAYNKRCAIEDPNGAGLSYEGWDQVCRAFRRAMPILTSSPDAIDAFIACVTHGMISRVFEPAEASRLLYAAQVAITSRRARAEAARHQPKSEPKQPQSESEPQPTPTPTPYSAEPKTAGAQSLATASSLPGVGDREPQPATPSPAAPKVPTTPLPPAANGGETPAAPQAPGISGKSIQAAQNQIEILLDQLLAGEVPLDHASEHFEPAVKAAPARRPPTPTPSSGTQQSQRAAS